MSFSNTILKKVSYIIHKPNKWLLHFVLNIWLYRFCSVFYKNTILGAKWFSSIRMSLANSAAARASTRLRWSHDVVATRALSGFWDYLLLVVFALLVLVSHTLAIAKAYVRNTADARGHALEHVRCKCVQVLPPSIQQISRVSAKKRQLRRRRTAALEQLERYHVETLRVALDLGHKRAEQQRVHRALEVDVLAGEVHEDLVAVVPDCRRCRSPCKLCWGWGRGRGSEYSPRWKTHLLVGGICKPDFSGAWC